MSDVRQGILVVANILEVVSQLTFWNRALVKH